MLGAGVSVLSTLDHLTFISAGSGTGFCAAIADSACQGAHTSPAAEILGIPISLLGIAFYFGTVVLAILSRLTGRRAARSFLIWGPTLLAAVSAASVGYSVYLASLLVAAEDWCPFCVTLYGVNLGLLATALAWAWPGLQRPSISGIARCALILVLAGSLAAAPAFAWYDSELAAAKAVLETSVEETAAQQIQHFNLPNLPERLPSKGHVGAPATIIEFSDFECPYCAEMHRILSTLFAHAGPGRLRVRFVNFPLDNKCNCYVSACVHETACLAARAAICAEKGGAFWAFAERSFENRRRHQREDLLRYAVEAGLDGTAFDTCLDSDETTQSLLNDIELAHSVGVEATPTLVINGVKFEGLMPLDRLQQSLDRSEVCACDLAAEFCAKHGNEPAPSCEMEVVDGPPSCE